MEILWSRREFSEVVMETIRQRFAYRDTELVGDALSFTLVFVREHSMFRRV